MRVVVDRDVCEGNALCVAALPEVFDLDEDDERALVLQEHPPTSLRKQVHEAMMRCPLAAITVEDD